MIIQGHTDSEIARMLKVGVSTIANYRNGGKNVQRNESIKSNGADEKSRKRRGNTDNDATRDQDPGRKSGDQNTVNDPPGKSTSGETKTGEGITFIGGKKDMNKKEGSGAKEEDEYQCYNCDYTQGSPFTNCPKCGSSNSFEE